MSLYGAIVPLANVFQPLVLWSSSRVASRKRLVIVLSGIGRPTFFALSLFALVKSGLRVELALIFFFVFELATSAVGAPWQSWMSELVDPELRGSYFGGRNLTTGLVAVPSALLAGYLLDLLGKRFLAFLAIFVVGSIFGAIDTFMFTRQDEDRHRRGGAIRLARLPRILVLAKDYRQYLGGMALVSFSGSLVGPYSTVMLINRFHYNYATLGLLAVCGTLAAAISQPIWGRLGDRHGALKMLKRALYVRPFLSLAWALALPSLAYMLPLQVFIGVIVTAGMGLMGFNVLLAVAPSFGKVEAFSFYTSVTNLAAVAGNIVSGLVLLPFLPISGNLSVWSLNPYRFVFLVSFLGRLGAAWYIAQLKLEHPR